MLLITDLDNTLYDWVTFHANAFRAMVASLSELLGVGNECLLDEFKAIHQSYGDSEQTQAVLDLPSVRKKLPALRPHEVMTALRPAFDAYETERKQLLRLYPGVLSSLRLLFTEGVTIVGHTEARAMTAYDRLERLDIRRYFKRLYALESCLEGRESLVRGVMCQPPPGFLQLIPPSERKPNPSLVTDICRREHAVLSDTWYVGDSIVRDMSMAKAAGVKAVWARYGTSYNSDLWAALVRVTHWTDEDVRREAELRKALGNTTPDFTIDSFEELPQLMLKTPVGAV